MKDPELDDDLLRRLLVGELDPSSDEGRRALEDPVLSEAFYELLTLASQLDSVATDGDAESTSSDEPVLSSSTVDQTLGELWAKEPEALTSSRPRLAIVGGLLAVAAGLVLLLVVVFEKASNDPGGGSRAPVLGAEDTITLLAPVDAGDPWDVFQWKVENQQGLRFNITIIDDATGDDLASERTTQLSWRPENASDWPDRIRWRVAAFLPGATDPMFESEWVRASR